MTNHTNPHLPVGPDDWWPVNPDEDHPVGISLDLDLTSTAMFENGIFATVTTIAGLERSFCLEFTSIDGQPMARAYWVDNYIDE